MAGAICRVLSLISLCLSKATSHLAIPIPSHYVKDEDDEDETIAAGPTKESSVRRKIGKLLNFWTNGRVMEKTKHPKNK